MTCGAGVRGVQTGGRENTLSAWEDVPQSVVDEDRETEAARREYHFCKRSYSWKLILVSFVVEYL